MEIGANKKVPYQQIQMRYERLDKPEIIQMSKFNRWLENTVLLAPVS